MNGTLQNGQNHQKHDNAPTVLQLNIMLYEAIPPLFILDLVTCFLQYPQVLVIKYTGNIGSMPTFGILF